ncbi:unnamed protein product [Cuscuta epithymum]|uniref:Uncharacterized protein n=1 Tax=Cuscuta epithymum TaxID=186058 RepID=A0AAV0BYZ3_9ASTE|nr:unnamed protein product [Cuscuta epithymum]
MRWRQQSGGGSDDDSCVMRPGEGGGWVINKKAQKAAFSGKGRGRRRGFGVHIKEQKGRLFIIRRCIVMLICWHD